MSGQIDLPAIGVEVVVDDSALRRVASSSSTVGSQLDAGLTKAKGSAQGLESSLGGVAQKLDAAALKTKGHTKAVEGLSAGTQTVTAHTLRFEQSLTTMMSHLGGVPPLANETARSLESITSSLSTAGLSATSVAGIVTAGVGLVVGALAETTKAYIDIGEQVENYRRVTGSSAEDSSRMVEVFTKLGVSEDVASSSMDKLARNIDGHIKKLEADGLQVATNSQGNVDMTRTLYNLADAYNATTDPTKKAGLLMDAFGKSGKEMIPVLEQGSANLKAYAASAGMVFSEKDLERLRDFQIQQAELTQNFREFEASIGSAVVPALDSVVRAENRSTEANQLMNDSLTDSQRTQIAISGHAGIAIKHYQDEADANYKAKQAADAFTKTLQEQADAEARDEAAIKGATDAVLGQADATFKLDDANNSVLVSQDNVNAAYATLVAARKQYGQNSPEYRAAEAAYTRAIDDQRKAYLDLAQATVAKAAADAKAAGDTMSAEDQTGLLIRTLEQEAKTLAPNSPLRQFLDGYIAKLIATPTDQYTTFHQRVVNDSGSTSTRGGTKAFALGGRPPERVPSLVGEDGVEVFTPDNPRHPQLLLGAKGPQAFAPAESGFISPHGVEPPVRNGMEAEFRALPLPDRKLEPATAVEPLPTQTAEARVVSPIPPMLAASLAPAPAASIASPPLGTPLIRQDSLKPPASPPVAGTFQRNAASLLTLPIVASSARSAARLGGLPVVHAATAPDVALPAAADVPVAAAPRAAVQPFTGALAPAATSSSEVLELLRAIADGVGRADPELKSVLRDLTESMSAEPSGQTGLEAALYKATQLAGLNRLRGMPGR